MKKNYVNALLEDKETQQFLKEMILQKADRHYELYKGILSEEEIEKLIQGKLTPGDLLKIVNNEIAKDEIALIERDLSSMCYSLNKSQNRVPKNTRWEQAYDHATQGVRIEDVASNLLGITNFRRNIKCPFHEDKSPSLKIYPDNNRFVCFGCGARGSPIDFVMKYKNCSFKEAVQYLSNL